MADESEGGDYEVGYSKPPVQHQFKPGESGRDRPRRKRGKNYASRRDAMLDTPIAYVQNGRETKLDTASAAFMKLRERGLKDGDYRVNLKIIELDRERHEEDLARAAISERRALEERELAMLKEALPRLRAKLEDGDV